MAPLEDKLSLLEEMEMFGDIGEVRLIEGGGEIRGKNLLD